MTDTNDQFLKLELAMHTFWAKYKGRILQTLVGMSFIIVVFVSIQFYLNYRKELCKDAYLNASTREKKILFVEEFAMDPLAGTLALELADEAFESGRLEEALDFYKNAIPALSTTALAGRAQLGKAMTLVLLGKTEEAKELLLQIESNTALLEGFRKEAGFKAGLL